MTYADQYWEQEIAFREKEKMELEASLGRLQQQVVEMAHAPLTDVARETQGAALVQQQDLVRGELERVETEIALLITCRDVIEKHISGEPGETHYHTEHRDITEEGNKLKLAEPGDSQKSTEKMYKEVGKSIETYLNAVEGTKDLSDPIGSSIILGLATAKMFEGKYEGAKEFIKEKLEEWKEKRLDGIEKSIAEHPPLEQEREQHQGWEDAFKADIEKRDLSDRFNKECKSLDENYVKQKDYLSDQQDKARERGDNTRVHECADGLQKLDVMREQMQKDIESRRAASLEEVRQREIDQNLERLREQQGRDVR